ncbi:MAG: glutamate ABC transporter substrate-binding protein [Actinomycetaceae bacterium]|nr:glutamate ABC transporter substrate-binding protein [Actinomycetaceae bacterium]
MKIRNILAITSAALLSIGSLSACSSQSASTQESSTVNTLNVSDYDQLLQNTPVASDEVIAKSTWASEIKKAGTLKIGGVSTSTLFALESIEDKKIRGFDSGLAQMLARYILGDNARVEQTQVTSSTREEVLINGTVNAVFATYSITDERKEKIDFAGPYFVSQQGILVKKNNSNISGLNDLSGKTVGVQAGSTTPDILKEFAPQANVKEYQTDDEIQEALAQGRIDAYVVDNTLLASAVAERPADFKIVGDPFGPEDPYGIGLPKGSDGAEFVNEFLNTITTNGSWEKLWKICIGDRTQQTQAPQAPTVAAKENE